MVVNFPNYGYNNNTSYWQVNDPFGDYKSHLEKIFSAINSAGEKVYFVHVDNPYDYATGVRPNPYGPAITMDWIKRILDLETQVKSYGLRFGLIYNSEIAGQGTDGRGGDDKQYSDDTLTFTKAYKDRGGNPDDTIIESWYTHPSNLLPDNQPYTFTNLVTTTFPDVLLLGDLDNNGKIDIYDYNQLITDFGKTGSAGFIPADINTDGKVDIYDYNILVGNFGK